METAMTQIQTSETILEYRPRLQRGTTSTVYDCRNVLNIWIFMSNRFCVKINLNS